MESRKSSFELKIKNIKNIPIYLLFTYSVIIVSFYLRQDTDANRKTAFTTGYMLILTVVCLISMIEIVQVRDFMKKHGRWINAVLLILSPAASFIMVETMVSNFNMEMFKTYSLYNIIWYIIIYYLIFALVRNAKVTVILGILLIYLASMLNYFVYLFRGNPILPSDLLAWRTGMSVADNYQVSFTQGFLIASLIMVTVYVLASKLEKTGHKPSVINRLAVVCTFLVFAAVIFNWFFDTDLIKSKIRVIDFFAPKYTYSSYGTAFGFVANVQAMETNSPEGYSVDKVQKALENAPASISQSQTAEDKPNIIVIMNEAYSDLSLIGDYKTNIPYRPYTNTLTENTIKGSMFTSVFGGATSDTEYEFLTGNSMAVMPQNCVPYQQFVTRPTDSLAATLKEQGYYNIAIHPYKPSGYKRDLVYPLLGFDEFLSMSDFKNPHLIRSYISDRDSFAKIIEEYENNKSKGPVFIFNVTMQDHGGYSAQQIFSDDETVRLTDYPTYKNVEQYLSLLRESDKAFETLVDYFKTQKKHTIILMFGDHQPVVYSNFHDAIANQPDAIEKKYQVPFIMWANYNLPKDDVDKISANYLSSYLLKTAGLKGTKYNDYLMEMYQQIPVINALFYIDKDGQLHHFSDATKDKDIINEYKYIGYNDAFDKKNKLNQYYYIN